MGTTPTTVSIGTARKWEYSGTPLIQTPMGQKKVSILVRCLCKQCVIPGVNDMVIDLVANHDPIYNISSWSFD